MADSLKQRFLKAIITLLLFWCLTSPALAQHIVSNATNITALPGYNQMSPQWKAMQIDGTKRCTIAPTDNRMTSFAWTNQSQYMQTVYPNNSAVVASLPNDYDFVIYLSDGNMLALMQGTGNESTGVIMTPLGQKVATIILDIDKVQCVASVRSGFLCYGITRSNNYTGKPVWKYFDNQGKSSPFLGQSLQAFIANETTCCIPTNINNTWSSWSGVSTDVGSFLLAFNFQGTDQCSVYVILTQPNSALLAIQPSLILSYSLIDSFALPNLTVLSCGALHYGQGYYCIIGETEMKYVTFTSKGVIDVKSIQENFSSMLSFPLYYGGMLMVDTFNNTLYFADEGMNIINTEPIAGFHMNLDAMCISNNNTVFVGNLCNNTTISTTCPWSYFSFDIKKTVPDDLGYKNLNIMDSTPAIGQTVSLDISISLSIDFWPDISQVHLNSGNISIYQQGQPFPRQIINANDFLLSNSTSIQSQQPLLSSTLNTPNATYYVEMDDGFVITTELLPGVQENNWVFQTGPRPYTYTDAVIVLVKFTDEGLKEYNRNLQFNDILLQELSQFIPISISCLEVISEHAYPNQSTNTQFGPGLYLNIQISSDTDNINSAIAQSSLAILITNLAQTNLQYGNITKFLDPNVRAVVQEDIWDQFKIPIIAIGISVVILLIAYILARRKYKEGRNLAIFTIVLNLSDFALDTLFVVFHNGDISTLTIPILVFYIVPFTFNLLMASKITLKEISSNEKFSEWCRGNVLITGIFTMLAITDVETLRVLDSHIAGLGIFNATFSSKAIRDMFIYSTLSFIIRDIPQLCIMILYKTASVQNYSIVPFLTLISSAVMCLVGILTRIYRAIVFFREKYIEDVAIKDLATADENEVDENEESADEIEEYTTDENEESITARQINVLTAETSNADESEESMSRQTNIVTADSIASNDETRQLINDGNVVTLG